MHPETCVAQDTPRYLIIPAAGLGTRMRALSPDVPKELLSVGGRPAIQYAIDEGIAAGIREIVIIISEQKEIIRRFFQDMHFAEKLYPLAGEGIEEINRTCSLTFLYQNKPSGEADAIGHAKDIAGNHAVAVIYPDNIYMPAPGALATLLPVYRKYRKDVIALNEVSDDISHTISNAGRVDISAMENDVYEIKRFLPKSGGHFRPRHKGELRACGMYISGPFIFDYIERARGMVKEGEYTDIYVRNLVLKEKGLLGCRLPGTVYDIGNPQGYRKCVAHVSPSL